ncbi:hypothetical protein Vadar_019995 [Vaccinium darrowii]|uniref:Uncharacterized protein n=1 Tax=Vaccinium darrowii TaxID=229202 RepID=A0ACB7ZCX9_9ERIC|nr:hypothetical protein Vadar_019995 [Vaccinium darrowii]
MQGLIIAGSDTTSVNLTWLIAMLLNNRTALTRAQEEIDTQIGEREAILTWVEMKPWGGKNPVVMDENPTVVLENPMLVLENPTVDENPTVVLENPTLTVMAIDNLMDENPTLTVMEIDRLMDDPFSSFVLP